jgi:2-iminobutanoate/2-iminopropanoate deaminase
MSHGVRAVHTADAPPAIGPYSQAIVQGGIVYCSGQIALDPESGKLVEGDVKRQTERVLDNLAAVLRAAGSGLERVLRTTVFLSSMADFTEMNVVYEHRFGSHRPARSTVAVRELPKGGLVEIAPARRSRPRQ